MPELLWKAFIDFEIEQQEYDRARRLYSKLLKKTQHVKVRERLFRNRNIKYTIFYFSCFFKLNKRFGSV
ncbi:MAG: hypothetical protein IT281_10205 [Ignavibacteria bacterium]|nr:hypothetical protein [Ignavibacteria bacterium]